MAVKTFTKPVQDSVSKVNGEVAVGEDLRFQRKWWKFERAIWILFTIIIILDLAGAFGRGWLAKANLRANDGSIDLKYERIERTGTPSILAVNFGPNTIHDGKIFLFVSNSIAKELGAQRIIPAPLTSAVGDGGTTYTFPATQLPAMVEFALQPASPGEYNFTIGIPNSAAAHARILVVP